MLALPTDPTGFPDGVELDEISCRECGTTGYAPANEHHVDHPSICEPCDRERLRQSLDAKNRDGHRERVGAFRRLQQRDFLPVIDPVDGDMVIDVNVDRGPPGTSSYIKSITKIVVRECPECGYDRANHSHWRVYTCESGEVVRCRACEFEIEENSTL